MLHQEVSQHCLGRLSISFAGQMKARLGVLTAEDGCPLGATTKPSRY
jgi:hypothetical protein